MTFVGGSKDEILDQEDENSTENKSKEESGRSNVNICDLCGKEYLEEEEQQ